MIFQLRITGDMTLSLLNDKGYKVLGVDMLAKGTMRAGTDGSFLARALNDLTLIAEISSNSGNGDFLARIKDTDISPRPWRCESSLSHKKVNVYDNQNKQIAARRFPKGLSENNYRNIIDALVCVVDMINNL